MYPPPHILKSECPTICILLLTTVTMNYKFP